MIFGYRDEYRPWLVVAALVAVALLLSGCTAAVKQVATYQVARDFYRARYDTSCHAAASPAWCTGFDRTLNRTDTDLGEANVALEWVRKAGARMPLQLKALKTDAAELKKGYKP